MTHKIGILFLFFYSNLIFAQFAIVQDKDGFCNVRNETQKKAEIVAKLSNGHLIYCLNFGEKPNYIWQEIDFKDNQIGTAHIYAHSVKYLNDFTKMPMRSKSEIAMELGNDSIQVTLKKKKFDAKKAKLTYNKTSTRVVEQINGNAIWGTDGNIPKMMYESITIEWGKQIIQLPSDAFQDLFEPTLKPDYTQATFDVANEVLYIFASNSDGAGGYEVVWKIEKGIYKERFIAHGF